MSSRLVYSTEGNNLCSKCGKVLHKCKCGESNRAQDSDGVLRISRETKGRKGAGVTIIRGLIGTAAELKQISKQLKSRCGVGGTIKDGVLEIQGDQRLPAKEFFESSGKRVKLVGG